MLSHDAEIVMLRRVADLRESLALQIEFWKLAALARAIIEESYTEHWEEYDGYEKVEDGGADEEHEEKEDDEDLELSPKSVALDDAGDSPESGAATRPNIEPLAPLFGKAAIRAFLMDFKRCVRLLFATTDADVDDVSSGGSEDEDSTDSENRYDAWVREVQRRFDEDWYVDEDNNTHYKFAEYTPV